MQLPTDIDILEVFVKFVIYKCHLLCRCNVERAIIRLGEFGNDSGYTIILILHYVSTDDEQ